jgi:hypothetical protein
MCSAAVEWVMGLGHDLGLVFQNLKTVWPTTQIEFLGLELDSVAMEACLPLDKLSFLRLLLHEWSVKHIACLWEVQELAGFLQFVSPCSCSFLYHIIDFSMKFYSPFKSAILEEVLELTFIGGIHFALHFMECAFWCLCFQMQWSTQMRAEEKALMVFIAHIGSPLAYHTGTVTEISSLRRPLLSFRLSFAGVTLRQVIMYFFIVIIRQ